MRKSLSKLLTCFIPGKQRRRAARHWLQTYSREGVRLFKVFEKADVRPNSVFICEANNGHGSVVVGYAKYFLDLGYNVDVLLTVKNLQDDGFCRLRSERLRVFGFGQHLLKKLLGLRKIKEYERVIITTTWCFWTADRSVPQVVGFMPQGKHKTLLVEHEQTDIELFGIQNLVQNRQIITLEKFPKGEMVAPVYLGDVEITPRHKEETIFVTVGAITPNCRDYTLLFSAVRHLLRNNKRIKITVIGSGKLEDLPEDIRPYIEIKGYLSYPEMFKQLENADFYLPLLNPENPKHLRYITTGVTGSAQLTYAFAKPCVIQEKFAAFYHLTPDNAVIYEADLGEAMCRAADIGEAEYKKLQQNLQKTAKNLYDLSLQNLKMMLKD